uniref:PPM-type phosphatase domain-containing protein n=1 Tax=Rhabditophanes sp. KR3021 TaxID=114890 RepID=A0AC35UD97_9BILA
MGATLSEPVTIKDTNSIQNDNYIVGSSCMQGWRIEMEDGHTHLLDNDNGAFFGVYDGHGGASVSQFASLHLHKRIMDNDKFKEGKIEEAIVEGYLAMDRQMLDDDVMKNDTSGSTSVVCIIHKGTLYTGWSGDSRAVCSYDSQSLPLSFDHKPMNKVEFERIQKAGGYVEFNRVNGNLALSRALGDFVYKRNKTVGASEQIVTAHPELTTHVMDDKFEFLIIACDGIWDVMTNQEAVDFVRSRLADGIAPEKVCEQMLDHCLSPDSRMEGLGCDNMTVIIVCLLQGGTYEQFVKKVSTAGNPKAVSKFVIPDVEVMSESAPQEQRPGRQESEEGNEGDELEGLRELDGLKEYLQKLVQAQGGDSQTLERLVRSGILRASEEDEDEPPIAFEIVDNGEEDGAVEVEDVTEDDTKVKNGNISESNGKL